MTRFVITLDQGVEFVLRALREMTGGEVFVPKLPSLRIVDLVPIIVPNGAYEVVGIRPGEKLHEVMIPVEESRNAFDMGDHYIIQPSHHWWNFASFQQRVKERGEPIAEPFEYSSNGNGWWMSEDERRRLVDSVKAA
jgi:UDP-N-acetylglucosamine 4,6-dehydratase